MAVGKRQKRKKQAEDDERLRRRIYLSLGSTVVAILGVLVYAVLYPPDQGSLLAIPTRQQAETLEDDVAPSTWNGSFTEVDKRCRIWQTDDFLSQDEIGHVLKLVKLSGGWGPSKTGGLTFQVPKTLYGGKWETLIRKDKVIRRIEERITAATGVPFHPHEDMLAIALMKPKPNMPRDGYVVPWGLHHDSDTRPHRVRTIIVYMNDVEEGGRTVFPLCGTPPSDADLRVRHDKFARAIGSMFGEAEMGSNRQVEFDIHSQHPFNDVLEQACRGNYGFAATPKRGRALLFDSQLPDGGYNTLTWHGGCNVVKGRKILLQKFKEMPKSKRTRLHNEPDPNYHPYVTH